MSRSARTARFGLVLVASCGSHAVVGSASPSSKVDGGDAAAVTAECAGARELRAEAVLLDHDGHLLLARERLKEANAACPAEQSTSGELEKAIATALAANDAPPKGTEATMRAKLHEAFDAERAKDWPKAKGLYLDAWSEHHPFPRALESAGRVSDFAGDAVESRRLRDRALAEAEATEHALPCVGAPVRVGSGMTRLVGTTAIVADKGRVIGRDAGTGELRVMLDASATKAAQEWNTLSPHGGLLVSGAYLWAGGNLLVYDVLTGALLFTAPNTSRHVVSPNDKYVVAFDAEDNSNPPAVHHARVYEVATGQIKSRLAGRFEGNGLVGFAPDDAHLIVTETDASNAGSIRQLDVEKGAYTGWRIPNPQSTPVATSLDGHWLTYLDTLASDTAALHVRDMVADKEAVSFSATFHSVTQLAIAPDGKTLATRSYNSLRLWDVSAKKQTFKSSYGDQGSLNDAWRYDFGDDSKEMLIGPTSWDVATGTEKRLIPDAQPKNILHVVKAPDGVGVALVLEDEVRLVGASGEPRTVCKGLAQPQWSTPTMIGPTAVAFSPSGKLFACAMWDGWVHVLDTSTWTEKAVIKRGAASTIDRPVNLVFSADDLALTDISSSGFTVYDAATGKETKKGSFAHAGVALAPRHVRFDDGTVGVRTWNGQLAVFAADGTWQRNVKLVAGAPADALDAFAGGGKTYAALVGKTLHVVDLATGDDKTTDVPTKAKSLAVSPDGAAVLIAGVDGTISSVSGGVMTPLAMKGIRVGFAGKAMLVWPEPATIDTYAVGAVGADASASPLSLEVDSTGLVVRDVRGEFETRGAPELVCVVGKTYLSRITCNDGAKDGVVTKWLGLVK